MALYCTNVIYYSANFVFGLSFHFILNLSLKGMSIDIITKVFYSFVWLIRRSCVVLHSVVHPILITPLYFEFVICVLVLHPLPTRHLHFMSSSEWRSSTRACISDHQKGILWMGIVHYMHGHNVFYSTQCRIASVDFAVTPKDNRRLQTI